MDRAATFRRDLLRYGAAVGLVLLAIAGAHLADQALTGANLAMVFLLCVLLAAVGAGLGPALVAALLAALSYNFFFLEPLHTFRIGRPGDVLTFAVFFAVALATGWLGGRARDNAARRAAQAAATATLLDASRALARAASADEAAQALAEHLASVTGGPAVVLLPGEGGLRLAGAPAGLSTLAAESLAMAEQVWSHAQSPTSSPGGESAEWSFSALQGVSGPVGVVGLRAGRPATEPDLAPALIEQGGVVVERAALASAAGENEVLRQADQLRAGVLNSISHDFRTPLASILGSATTLYEYEQQLTSAVRRDLMRSIQEDAERLNAHVGALLDMGRLEGGALKPREEWVDVRELIGSAIRRLAARLGDHKIERDFADRLSLVKADPTLVEQAILNLLDNAAVHTPAGGTLRIAAHEDGRWVMVSVDDEGPGVPADQQAAIFDKFRRGPSDRTGGLGLGLSITKGFVEAMGGRVALVSPLGPSGGSRFMISLGKVAETPRGLL